MQVLRVACLSAVSPGVYVLSHIALKLEYIIDLPRISSVRDDEELYHSNDGRALGNFEHPHVVRGCQCQYVGSTKYMSISSSMIVRTQRPARDLQASTYCGKAKVKGWSRACETVGWAKGLPYRW